VLLPPFKEATQIFLPNRLREFLVSDDMKRWHDVYLKGYRDVLAHCIPLYIPPANWPGAWALYAVYSTIIAA
jgi:hypothetical protein